MVLCRCLNLWGFCGFCCVLYYYNSFFGLGVGELGVDVCFRKIISFIVSLVDFVEMIVFD